MKFRIISMILIVAMIPVILAVPSFASFDVQSPFVDLFSYGLGISGFSGGVTYFDGWSFGVKSGTVNLELPSPSSVFYVDFILYLGAGWGPTLNFKVYNSVLQTSYFGPYNNYVRVFGDVATPSASNRYIPLTIEQVGTDYTVYPSILSAKFCSLADSLFDLSSTGYLTGEYLPGTNIELPGLEVISSTGSTYGGFDFYIYAPSNWKLYDYLTVQVMVNTHKLDSVTVGDGSIPFEVSYIAPPGDAVTTYFLFDITLDLTKVDKSSSVDPEIRLSGMAGPSAVHQFWGVSYIKGWLLTGSEEVYIPWFKKLISSISSGFSSVGTWFQTQTSSITGVIESWGQNIVHAILGNQENPPDTSAGDDLVNQGQQIQDFEQQHQDVVNNNIGAITDSLDLTGFAPAMNLISSYVGAVFGVLGPYQQVFILPISLGIIFFICSRAPGIQVPREKVISPGVKIYRRSSKEVSS